MSKLNQLAKLAQSHPIYFSHQYKKELEHAQSRKPTSQTLSTEDKLWIKEEEGRILEYLKPNEEVKPKRKGRKPKATGDLPKA